MLLLSRLLLPEGRLHLRRLLNELLAAHLLQLRLPTRLLLLLHDLRGLPRLLLSRSRRGGRWRRRDIGSRKRGILLWLRWLLELLAAVIHRRYSTGGSVLAHGALTRKLNIPHHSLLLRFV